MTQIDSKGLFTNTDLREGMVLVALDGRRFSSYQEGLALLKAAEGQLTVSADAASFEQLLATKLKRLSGEKAVTP